MQDSDYDVAIIGGGVIGCAIARELSRFRLQTVVLEKNAEVGFGTSKTNSGIIHPGHDTSPQLLKGRLVVPGNALFDRLCLELNFGFARIGQLNVARNEEELALLDGLLAQGKEKGVPGLAIWDKARLSKEEPNLSRDLVGALYAPSAGVINPYELAFALIENAIDNEVELRVGAPVVGIDAQGDRLVLHTPEGRLRSAFVINCAGLFADQVARFVSCDTFTIKPRKGEEYMLDKRLRGLVRRLIFPVPTKTTKGTLIIPTFDGTIMVGPTADDVEDCDDVTTTPEGATNVFQTVKSLCPAIEARDAITAFAGLRAVADSNDFIIGTTAVRGFINVAGIQSPGLTSAPAIANHVRDILIDEGLTLKPRSRFRAKVAGPPRFSLQSPKDQEESVLQNPLFGKVVCRCELVTEAEIHDAIDHGATTLDGIKFRSRAGMGRCQGGFCTSRCMEVLSARLGAPLEDITKRGPGSELTYAISSKTES